MPSGFLYGYVYTQLSVYTNKNVEPVLSLVPQCKGLRIALPVETSNVESPTSV